MPKIDFKNATVKIKDGTGTPLECEIVSGDGTVSWSEKYPKEFVLNRGKIWQVREGDEQPCEVKLDIVWEYLRGETSGTVQPYEAFKRIGLAAAWVSVGGACEPYAVTIEIIHTPICTSEDLEKIVFTPFFLEGIDGDIKAGSLSVMGKLNAEGPTITRVAR